MKINLSFFKKSAITGSILAIVAGVVLAFFAHANAINNNQVTTHGAGYVLGMTSDKTNLTKITPDSLPKNCGDFSKPTAACPCKPANSDKNPLCKCLKLNDPTCKVCTQSQPSVCYWCPPKGMGIACRVFDNDNEGGGVVTPPSNNAGTSQGSSQGSVYTQPTTTDPNAGGSIGGNTTGQDNNPSPTTNPGCNQNTSPAMGINCRAPGSGPKDPQPCGYRQVCTAQ